MKKCAKCQKQNLVQVDDIVNDLGGYLIITKGIRCTSCGEEYLDEEEGQKMINLAKRLKVWGQPMKLHRKLSKSERGTVLRIPIDIEKELHLKGTEEVSISKVGENKILIEVEK